MKRFFLFLSKVPSSFFTEKSERFALTACCLPCTIAESAFTIKVGFHHVGKHYVRLRDLPPRLRLLRAWFGEFLADVLHFGPPAITTGTGQLSTTALNVSIVPVSFALRTSAPSSAPILLVRNHFLRVLILDFWSSRGHHG